MTSIKHLPVHISHSFIPQRKTNTNNKYHNQTYQAYVMKWLN